MKKGDLPRDDIPSRVKRLEKNMELQLSLNEQFINEMHILKPVIEGLHTSIKLIFYLALFACLIAIVALVLLLFK